MTLAPDTHLQARNRHQYVVQRGAAFFDVRKDRPQVANEFFEVEGSGVGTVRVTGTAFSVDLRTISSPVVVVKEGTVEVRRDGVVIGALLPRREHGAHAHARSLSVRVRR